MQQKTMRVKSWDPTRTDTSLVIVLFGFLFQSNLLDPVRN